MNRNVHFRYKQSSFNSNKKNYTACVLLNTSRPLCITTRHSMIAEVPSCEVLMMIKVLKCNMHTWAPASGKLQKKNLCMCVYTVQYISFQLTGFTTELWLTYKSRWPSRHRWELITHQPNLPTVKSPDANGYVHSTHIRTQTHTPTAVILCFSLGDT